MKIGIFGGSFNPPHKMHEKIARDLIKKKLVEKIIFVPVGNMYQKKDLIDFGKRIEMLNIMTRDYDNIIVSDIERNNNYQYTYQILDYFKEINPNDEIYFICGMDNLEEFSTWKNYSYILENYKLLVINRDNLEFTNIKNRYPNNKNIINTNIKAKNISSSMIRNLIKDKKDVNKYLRLCVYRYIIDNEIYK